MNLRVVLSGFQVVTFTASSFLPLTYFIFPRLAIAHGYTDSLWGVLGLMVVGIGIAWLHSSLNRLFPNVTGADFPILALGKVIGTVIGAAYLPLYILFVGMCMYNFSIVMQATLPTTPTLGIVLSMCLVCFVGAWYGLEALARVASIIYPLTFFGVFVTFCFIIGQMSAHEMSLTLVSWRAVARVVYYGLPTYLGYSIALMVNPYFPNKTSGKVHTLLISMGLNGVLVLMNFLSTVLVLGYDPTSKIAFPFPFLLRLLRLTAFPIERVGISVVILTTAFTLLFVSNHIWALSTLTARLFFVKDDQYKHFIPPIVLLIALAAGSFESEQQSFDILEAVLAPWSWFLLVIFPMLIWVTAKVRGVGQSKSSSKRRQAGG